jgi:hypothetical protein
VGVWEGGGGVSRSHDIADELQWVEYQRDQWEACAEKLCAAMLFFGRERVVAAGHSAEKNALLLYQALKRAFSKEGLE